MACASVENSLAPAGVAGVVGAGRAVEVGGGVGLVVGAVAVGAGAGAAGAAVGVGPGADGVAGAAVVGCVGLLLFEHAAAARHSAAVAASRELNLYMLSN